ncbi:hypothetical protein V6Z11_A03G148900 [Gossypium hirsutum]
MSLSWCFFFSLVSVNYSCPSPSPKPKPNPTPSPTPTAEGKYPINILKLGVCAKVLVQPCCTLIKGLVDLEAVVCLCTMIKGTILGINLNIPVSFSLLLNVCSKKVPFDFQCP